MGGELVDGVGEAQPEFGEEPAICLVYKHYRRPMLLGKSPSSFSKAEVGGGGGTLGAVNDNWYRGGYRIHKGVIWLRDWLLITGRAGATKWENRRSKNVHTPPASRQGNNFHILLLKG